MLSRYTHGDLVWIDLQSPTREEVVSIATEFGIDDVLAGELLIPSNKPRVELHGQHIYMIMHFPALRHSHTSKEQEVDFVLGKKFLITAHYDTIDSIHKFSKVFEVNATLEKNSIGDHAGFLLFFILKKLYKAVEHEMEYIRQDLTRIEDRMFSGEELDLVSTISRDARDLINIRQIIEPHREVLRDIEEHSPQLFGEPFRQYARAVSNEYYRVHSHVMRNTEMLRELRETNNSLLTTKQNETMRRFTILAFITFPLSLLVAIFGFASPSNPIQSIHNGFWIVLTVIVVVMGFMFWYFKRQNWL